MAGKLTSWSDADLGALREVLHWFRRRGGSEPPRPRADLGDELTAPEVYAALVPGDGIPARIEQSVFSADCQVYRVIDDELVAAGFTRRVYNFTDADVDGDTYVLAVRDKFGTWKVAAGGGSAVTADETAHVRKASTTLLGTDDVGKWYSARTETIDFEERTWAVDNPRAYVIYNGTGAMTSTKPYLCRLHGYGSPPNDSEVEYFEATCGGATRSAPVDGLVLYINEAFAPGTAGGTVQPQVVPLDGDGAGLWTASVEDDGGGVWDVTFSFDTGSDPCYMLIQFNGTLVGGTTGSSSYWSTAVTFPEPPGTTELNATFSGDPLTGRPPSATGDGEPINAAVRGGSARPVYVTDFDCCVPDDFVDSGCCDDPLPAVLTGTLTNKTGSATVLPDTVELVIAGNRWIWRVGNPAGPAGTETYYYEPANGLPLWGAVGIEVTCANFGDHVEVSALFGGAGFRLLVNGVAETFEGIGTCGSSSTGEATVPLVEGSGGSGSGGCTPFDVDFGTIEIHADGGAVCGTFDFRVTE